MKEAAKSEASSPNSRILIVDDHAIVRDGLRCLIRHEKDMEVVASAADGQAALRAMREHRPDIIIMDINMPKLNGMVTTAQAIKEAPSTQVIALSMHTEWEFVEAMRSAGARGFVHKSSAAAELILAIRTVLSGRTYFPEREVWQEPSSEQDGIPITNRERQVLTLIGDGLTVAEIASRLYITISTVHTHRRHLKEKLQLSTTGELVKYALRMGMVKP